MIKLQERAATDETFAAALARESGEDASKIKFGPILKSDGLLTTSMGNYCLQFLKGHIKQQGSEYKIPDYWVHLKTKQVCSLVSERSA